MLYRFVIIILYCYFQIAGTRVAFRNAIFGGLLLGLIQLVEVGMIKWNMRREMQMYHKMHEEQMEKQTQQLKEMRPGKRTNE